MILPQIALDEVKPQNDSVPLSIQEPSGVDLSEAGTKDWIALLWSLAVEQINRERMRSENYQMAASPGLCISEAPIHENTTAPTDFEVHLTLGEETLSVEGDILRGEFMEPRPTPSSTLSRIQARQPQILRRALEIRQEYGDPIQNLAELLGNMPGSQEDWEALIDEPYY